MNTAPLESTVATLQYQLRSITKTTAPADCEGTWFRYVIAQGSNEIAGLRTGTAAAVEFDVRQMVEDLNLRSSGKTVKKIKPARNP